MTQRALKITAVIWLAMFAACTSTAATSDLDDSRNAKALKTARENIERFRKGDASLKIVDANGKPVSAKVAIKQITHDFKFGCYLKIDDLAPEKAANYEKHFSRLFNYAVVGTYWDFIETERGKKNWRWFERETALAKNLNLQIQAAPVLWGTIEFGTPKWLPSEKEDLNFVLVNHVREVLQKGSEKITDWEIVNEPLAPKTDIFAKIAGDDYIEKAFRTARETSPEARLMINEYGVFGALEKHSYNRERYFDTVKNLLEKNAPVDVVGIQAHANGEWFAPADVAAELERYASLGKPLQITEFSAQTLDFDDRKTPLAISGNYRNGIWDAEKQAESYCEFYTVAFGNPMIEAITTWGLDDERAWLPGIGLIDENGSPKLNYKTLDRLINKEWRTNLETVTDNKLLNFRGFYGDYEVEATIGSKKMKSVFALKKDSRNEWIIKVK